MEKKPTEFVDAEAQTELDKVGMHSKIKFKTVRG